MDANGVGRAALIASVPGDEASVAAAVARHPATVRRLLHGRSGARRRAGADRNARSPNCGLTGVCLFPAMHHVPLDDERTLRVVQAAAACPGAVVFVHCGRLSVGVRGQARDCQAASISRSAIRIALSRAGGGLPGSAVHRSALRRRTLRRRARGGRRLRQRAPRHVELEQLDSRRPRARLSRTSSHPRLRRRAQRGCSSAPIRRSFRAAGSAGFTSSRRSPSIDLRVSDEDKSLIFGGNFERLFPRDQTIGDPMKAIVVREFGPAEVMKLEEVPDPTPGPGQVVVRAKAIGVNPVEAYIRSGTYARKPNLPYTPGTDVAGIVEAVGSDVKSVKKGDRVYTHGTAAGSGGYAELIAVRRSAGASAARARLVRARRGAGRARTAPPGARCSRAPGPSRRDAARSRRQRRRRRRRDAARARPRDAGHRHRGHREGARARPRAGRARGAQPHARPTTCRR